MKTVIMFPGQGSQHTGMGSELFDQFPEITAQASEILNYDVKTMCLAPEHSETINQTAYTQPLLFLVNALSQMHHLQTGGSPGDIFVGHSLGEYNALLASKVFSLEIGLKLVQTRGQLMEAAGKSATTPGSMLAVLGLEENTILEVITIQQKTQEVFIANLNAPGQIILSGKKESLQLLEEPLKTAGARKCVFLTVSGAFHSPYMESAREKMREVLANCQFQPPQKPIYANLSATPYPSDENQIKEILANQLTHKVRWSETITNIRQDEAETTFIEIGPGKVLTGLLKRIK